MASISHSCQAFNIVLSFHCHLAISTDLSIEGGLDFEGKHYFHIQILGNFEMRLGLHLKRVLCCRMSSLQGYNPFGMLVELDLVRFLFYVIHVCLYL